MPACVQFLDSGAVALIRSEVVLRLHDFDFGFDDAVDDRRQVVRAHAHEPDFALLLGFALGFDQFIGNLRRVAQAMKVPDVQVVGVEFLQAGVELRQDARAGMRIALARQEDVFPPGSQRRSHHALVLAALVVAGGIEVVDAHIHGPGDHGGVGGDHAAIAYGGDPHAGLAQGPIMQRRAGRRPGGRLGLRLFGIRGTGCRRDGRQG